MSALQWLGTIALLSGLGYVTCIALARYSNRRQRAKHIQSLRSELEAEAIRSGRAGVYAGPIIHGHFRGVWQHSGFYMRNDIVEHNKRSYVLVYDVGNMEEPGTGLRWEQLPEVGQFYSKPCTYESSISWKGEWNSETQYRFGSGVSHNGQAWMHCQATPTINAEPGVSGAWIAITEELSYAGDPGDGKEEHF